MTAVGGSAPSNCVRCGDGCKRAGIGPAVSFHVLRHTHASILAMRAVPMAVIARQLGHSDTRMTERHYAHLAPNYVADTIRASFPRLTETKAPTVVPIERARRNYRQAR
jgi:site-specific recombinase XerC